MQVQTEGHTSRAAISAARELYKQIRGRAALPPANEPPEVFSAGETTRSVYRDPRFAELHQLARRLKDDGHLEAAVIVGQSACETLAASAFNHLLRRREYGLGQRDRLAGAVRLSVLRNFNLRDARTLAIWRVLTGARVNREAFWAEYVRASQRGRARGCRSVGRRRSGLARGRG